MYLENIFAKFISILFSLKDVLKRLNNKKLFVTSILEASNKFIIFIFGANFSLPLFISFIIFSFSRIKSFKYFNRLFLYCEKN